MALCMEDVDGLPSDLIEHSTSVEVPESKEPTAFKYHSVMSISAVWYTSVTAIST